MTTLARGADPADIDAWWDSTATRALRIISVAAGVTATMGARYLRQHAAIEGVNVTPIRTLPNMAAVTTSLRVMGPVAFKTHMRLSGSETASLRIMVEQLSGTASSRALDGQRNTVMSTFAERDQLVGWRRITSGDPCDFCARLASRGAVYSKETVAFQAHKPRCRCTPEPLYRRESDLAPLSTSLIRAGQ